MAPEIDMCIWKYLWIEMKWAEGEEFKEHNSVSRRNMSPPRSRDFRGSKREHVNLKSSRWEPGMSSYTWGRFELWNKGIALSCLLKIFWQDTLLPLVWWWPHGKSTRCLWVHDDPLLLFIASLYRREPQREKEGSQSQLCFHPSSLDRKTHQQRTWGQRALPKSMMSLHLPLGDLHHHQAFMFPWQAKVRRVLHLAWDIPWY